MGSQVDRAPQVHGHHRTRFTEFESDVDGKVVHDRPIYEDVAIRCTHGREDPGDRDAGAESLPNRAGLMNLNFALRKVARYAEVVEPQILYLGVTERLPQLVADFGTASESDHRRSQVERRSQIDERPNRDVPALLPTTP